MNRLTEKIKGAALFAALCVLVYLIGDGVFCQLKAFTGLPCPGCGLTRAFTCLLSGQWAQSFFYHPLWPLILLLAVLYFMNLFFDNRLIYNQKLILSVLGAFLGVYLIRMIFMFPHTAPMDYYSNGFFPRLFQKMMVR